MTIAENIAKIRALALTAKASIYNEDAMTAIELAGVTACKVNECVETINMMLDTLEKVMLETGLQVGYESTDESLIM